MRFALLFWGGFSILAHISCRRDQTTSGDFLFFWPTLDRHRDSRCDYLFPPAAIYRGGGGCRVGPGRCEVGPAGFLHPDSAARLHLCIRHLCSDPMDTDTVEGGALCPFPPFHFPAPPPLPPHSLSLSLTLLPASSAGSRCAQTRSAFRGARTSMAPRHTDCAIQTASRLS